jgi:hypothetical protein
MSEESKGLSSNIAQETLQVQYLACVYQRWKTPYENSLITPPAYAIF